MAEEGADVATSYSSSTDQAEAVLTGLEAKRVRAAVVKAIETAMPAAWVGFFDFA